MSSLNFPCHVFFKYSFFSLGYYFFVVFFVYFFPASPWLYLNGTGYLHLIEGFRLCLNVSRSHAQKGPILPPDIPLLFSSMPEYFPPFKSEFLCFLRMQNASFYSPGVVDYVHSCGLEKGEHMYFSIPSSACADMWGNVMVQKWREVVTISKQQAPLFFTHSLVDLVTKIKHFFFHKAFTHRPFIFSGYLRFPPKKKSKPHIG